MAWLEITFKIMPDSPDANLNDINSAAKKEIEKAGGKVRQEKIEPVAFGIQAVVLTISWEESKGTTDALEDNMRKIPHVISAEITHITRALG